MINENDNVCDISSNETNEMIMTINDDQWKIEREIMKMIIEMKSQWMK